MKSARQSDAVTRLFGAVSTALRPPKDMSYSEWASENFKLSGVSSAATGRFRPWKFQRGILDAIGDPLLERVSVIKSARTGYALALDTPIATPSGWTSMADLKVGDEVYDERGVPTKVIVKSEIFVDHDCYRVQFCDGSEIVADGDHLWQVDSDRSFELMLEGRFVRGPGARATMSGILNTRQLVDFMSRSKRSIFAVQNAKPIEGRSADLPIPPYTLGLWLGDGHSVTPRITQCVDDIETAGYIEEEGIKVTVFGDDRYPRNRYYLLDTAGGRRAPSPWARVFREVGLLHPGKGGPAAKHIPEQYLRAPLADRLALIRGIMDSDGSIDLRGMCDISVTSRRLADGLFELLVSVGYKVCRSERAPLKAHHLHQYRLHFRPSPEMNPFRIARKAARVVEQPRPTINNRRRVSSIEPVPSVPCCCIGVDSPNSLFLASRSMIPTHNTKSLIAAIGATAVNDPCPIGLLMPTDDDTRGIAVDEIDPAFTESPALRGVMKVGRFDGRNTLTQRMLLGGGSLKILSAMAPRNLRRHTLKVLYCDEVDGMKVTKEGDPIKLAEKRTLSFADRKIVMGSTPVDEATSIIIKRYEESDMRIFEIPCIHCDVPFELLWEHLDWEEGTPETVQAYCPSCGTGIEERFKPQMVEAGEWRPTKPEVKGHAGFRLNALISLFANASWVKLVEEYELAKKNGQSDMQVFFNTVLGKVWSSAIESVSESQLMARREEFGIAWLAEESRWREEVPAEVAYITAGVDVQVDRLEITLLGHSADHRWILGHHVIWGGTNLRTTWEELRAALSTVWKHPFGGTIGIEAAAVDAGDGNRTQQVYDFCETTQAQKIFATKGDDGPRKILEVSKKRRRNRTAPLYIVGVDQVKTDILTMLPKEKGEQQAFRLSNSLTEEYILQLNSERRILKYKTTDGRPVIVFERIGKRKAEALDSLVYAIAIKQVCRFDFEKRYEELKGRPEQKKSLRDHVSRLHG